MAYTPKPRPKQIRDTLLLMGSHKNSPALERLILSFDLEAEDQKNYEYYTSKELIEIIKEGNNIKQKNKMGKETYESNRNYNIIVSGKFGVFCKEKTEKSKTITSKSGVKREYELFKNISGKITKMYIYEKNINNEDVEFLVIYVTDKVNGKEIHEVIETSFKGYYADDFLLRIKNVDLTKDVKLTPYSVKDAEKSKEKGKDVYNTGISIEQDGKKIERFYTKDNPGDLPKMVEKKVKGGKKSEWDMTDRQEFLRNLVLSKAEEIKNITDDAEPETKEILEGEQINDDLPY